MSGSKLSSVSTVNFGAQKMRLLVDHRNSVDQWQMNHLLEFERDLTLEFTGATFHVLQFHLSDELQLARSMRSLTS
jgi:hypothetical protein